jgi:hypothetical protein
LQHPGRIAATGVRAFDMNNQQMHDRDFYAWANEPAERLKSSLGQTVAAAHRNAILDVVRKAGFQRSVFSVACPWSFQRIMDPSFYPDPNFLPRSDKLNTDGTS